MIINLYYSGYPIAVYMKKILPLLFLIVGFSLFLASQVAFDLFSTRASLSSEKIAKYKHFNRIVQNIDLFNIKGEKIDFDKTPIVILNFWASWCVPCLKEFPSLQALREKFSTSELQILAVNSDDRDLPKTIAALERKMNLKLTFDFLNQHSGLSQKFKVTSVPTTIVFAKGKVLEISDGAKNFLDKDFISTLKTNL